jgi:negative regulator of flagellin synthesis FlgM
MKIGNGIEDLSQVFPSQGANNTSTTKGTPSPQNESLNGDKAQLSTLATQLAQSAESSDIRLDKVASIQNALQMGNYQVSATEVAKKVMTSMLAPEK